MIRITVEHDFDGHEYTGSVKIHQYEGAAKVQRFDNYDQLNSAVYKVIMMALGDVEVDTINIIDGKIQTRRMLFNARVLAVQRGGEDMRGNE